jgi:2-(3-amino-3-carboxypropyl)histidine synthase
MEPAVPSAPARQAPPARQGGAAGAARAETAAERRARMLARRKKSNVPKTPEEILKAKQRAEKRALRRAQRTMPDDIQNNVELNATIAKQIPNNYSFEIKKTLWRVRKGKAKTVALQFPEGLLMYSCIITDILQKFGDVDDVLIMGDVTYGACCVDDYSAKALGADLLVHYGHSCLVPINNTTIPVQYVFVDIQIDVSHLIDCIVLNFPDKTTRLAIMGTIQFSTAINAAAMHLQQRHGFGPVVVPQAKPLSRGEVLGCTSPVLGETIDAFVFVADGRFHLESAMIHNPKVPAYQYDPYGKTFTIETYDIEQMRGVRHGAIKKARGGKSWGVILGTLGRQGSETILKNICKKLDQQGKKYFVLLLSEIFPAKLKLFANSVDVWVQIACPRLSVDWGSHFYAPLLNPYEANVVLGTAEWKSLYPMDFYSKGSGPWTNYHEKD